MFYLSKCVWPLPLVKSEEPPRYKKVNVAQPPQHLQLRELHVYGPCETPGIVLKHYCGWSFGALPLSNMQWANDPLPLKGRKVLLYVKMNDSIPLIRTFLSLDQGLSPRSPVTLQEV